MLASESTLTPPESTAAPDPRQAAIEQYLAQALGQDDPLNKNLDLLTGDLLSMAYRQQQLAQAHLAQPGHPDLREERFVRAAERHLRIVRQTERFIRLRRELGRTELALDRGGFVTAGSGTGRSGAGFVERENGAF